MMQAFSFVLFNQFQDARQRALTLLLKINNLTVHLPTPPH
jgi:hypothetical protein